MFGLGTPELLVILGIVALLFGPAIVAFAAGYMLGERRGSSQGSAGGSQATADKPPVTEAPSAPAESSAPREETRPETPGDQSDASGESAEPEEENGDLHV